MRHSSGIEVSLVSDGVKMHEYDHDSGEATTVHTVRKWVGAVTDATFAVEWSLPYHTAPSPEDCVVLCIYLDGKCVKRPVRRLYNGGLILPDMCEGVDFNTPEGSRLQKFAFGKLQTSRYSLFSPLPSLIAQQRRR
jgi:hypothetical protein